MKLYFIILIYIFTFTSCTPNSESQNALKYNNTAISFATKNIDSAIYYFDKAIAMDSNYLLAYQNKANLLTSIGEYNKALAQVNILSSKLENSETYKMKGLLNDLTSQKTIATENYAKSIVLIDDEVKRVNDFLKYKKLYQKGTMYLLLNKNQEGIDLIQTYSRQANISDARKDSIIQFQNNREELLKILILP